MLLLLHLLPLLTLTAALPHTKQDKKSLSIAFTQRNVHARAPNFSSRLRKRQSPSSGDDVSELLNDNNVRYACFHNALDRSRG